MIVLGIDTATRVAGVAIVEGDPGGGAPVRTLAELRHDGGARGADLLIAIDEVARRAQLAPARLDAVAIGAGPGSFTGLRIGMATAKGIAFAAGRPLWAVSSLAALAADAAAQAAAAAEPGAVIAAVLDARRGEVFAGCFRGGAPLAEERVLPPGELAGWIDQVRAAAGAAAGSLHLVGDALAAHPSLGPLAARWLPVATPSGAAVARLALAGPREDVVTAGAPTYIRPSEAEVNYPDGVPGALRRR